MIDIVQAGTIIMGGIILLSVLKTVHLLSLRTAVGNSARLEVVAEENVEIKSLSGEANPVCYREFVRQVLLKQGLRISAIIGPDILFTREDYFQAFDGEGNLTHEDKLLQIHPLLKAWSEDGSGRIRLWIRGKKIGTPPDYLEEKHFMVGVSSGICFCETHHEVSKPRGGHLFRSNDAIYKRKLWEFERIANNPDYSCELTRENFVDLLRPSCVEPPKFKQAELEVHLEQAA